MVMLLNISDSYNQHRLNPALLPIRYPETIQKEKKIVTALKEI